jgi:hypothetical protein
VANLEVAIAAKLVHLILKNKAPVIVRNGNRIRVTTNGGIVEYPLLAQTQTRQRSNA